MVTVPYKQLACEQGWDNTKDPGCIYNFHGLLECKSYCNNVV